MSNILDYLAWRGDLDLRAVELGPLDFAVLASIVYLPFERLNAEEMCGRTLGELSTVFADELAPTTEKDWDLGRSALWRALPAYPRFADMVLERFAYDFEDHGIDDADKQFCAASFIAGDTAIVAYRGTDSTLVGWREDFTMSYKTVPSLPQAVAFLEAAPELCGGVHVCGHSKGGYLAMAAAVGVADPARIRGVWNFDGPGLKDEELATPAWQLLAPAVHTYIPESSIIGRLYGHGVARRVVKSEGASIMQHDIFNWHVLGADFVAADSLTRSSELLAKAFDEFACGVSDEERRITIDAMFKLAASTGAERTDDLALAMVKNLPQVLKSVQYTDAEKAAIRRVLGAMMRNMTEDFSLREAWEATGVADALSGFGEAAGAKVTELTEYAGAKVSEVIGGRRDR